MRANLFWLNDEQWAKIKPFIPMNRPDQKPRNNRRILSGIIHVLKTGCRWQDCPPEYGPYTTVHNRFNRWSGFCPTRISSWNHTSSGVPGASPVRTSATRMGKFF
jgi:transposase